MGNLTDDHGTDVEILRWADGLVWAHCRTSLPEPAHQILRSCGFTAPLDSADPVSYRLPKEMADPDQRLAASSASSLLSDLGFAVAIDPDLAVGYTGATHNIAEQRLAAARRTSPAAARADATTRPPTTTAAVPAAKVPQQRKR
ncbi:hypothetical protein GCM10009665_78390 [Kitasatospora nipponensis]|uniref:Uncharacterized protein n=1 Tax=Kitasatospora nipponensis TaxID=258049 RepID=A0ABN1TA66_9ACTN